MGDAGPELQSPDPPLTGGPDYEMKRIVLIPGRWPFASATEFLDDEIHYIADGFSEVQVAPLRPESVPSRPVPKNVTVDLTLAARLRSANRIILEGFLGGLGFLRRTEFKKLGLLDSVSANWQDGLWARTALIGIAQAIAVSNWCREQVAPDIAYTYWLGGPTLGCHLGWPDTPVVSRAHGGDLYPTAYGWTTIPLQAAAIESAVIVATVSDHGRRYLENAYHCSGVFETHRLGIKTLRSRSSVDPTDSISILSVSAVNDNKRVDHVADAVAALAQDGVRVRWTHVGSGPKLRTLGDHVEALGIASLTRLTGQLTAEATRNLFEFGWHDVFVNMSLSEGAPVTLMEAQCVGIPSVLSDVGGSPEVAPPHLNEVLAVHSEPHDIASAILHAYGRPLSERTLRHQYWSARYEASANYRIWADRLLEISR